jgi:hypothetical protein
MYIFEEKTVVSKIYYKDGRINNTKSNYYGYWIIKYDDGGEVRISHVGNPYFEYNIGTKVFLKNYQYHNKSGAAMISKNREKVYWLNGKLYPDITSDEEWLIKQIIE